MAALHLRREPLGLTAFEVLAGLSALANVPAIEGPEVDARTATEDDLAAAVRQAERLHDAWLPVDEGDAFPWWGVKAASGTAAEREVIRTILLQGREAVVSLEALDRELGRACEWAMPGSQDERRAHARFGDAVPGRRLAPAEWLTTDDLTPYSALMGTWEQRSGEHDRLVSELEASYGPRWRELRPEIHGELTAELAALAAHLGVTPDWGALEAGLPGLTASGDDVLGDIATAEARLRELQDLLGLRSSLSRDGALRAVAVGRASQARNRPASAWMSKARLSEAEAFLAQHGAMYPAQRASHAALAERYEDEVLGLDLDPITDRMSRWSGRFWNLWRPQHRARSRGDQERSREAGRCCRRSSTT